MNNAAMTKAFSSSRPIFGIDVAITYGYSSTAGGAVAFRDRFNNYRKITAAQNKSSGGRGVCNDRSEAFIRGVRPAAACMTLQATNICIFPHQAV